MFGIRPKRRIRKSSDESLEVLIRTLDRQACTRGLQHLKSAFEDSKISIKRNRIAFGIDTNIIIKLGNYPRRVDILDFWARDDVGPLIIPGQLIQEFWNNVDSIHSLSQSAKNKFNQLEKDLEKIKGIDSAFQEKIESALEDFGRDFSPLLDESFQDKAYSTIESLEETGRLAFVPRSTFYAIARLRNETKTPPGFKDSGYGDFFIWADFLYGLMLEKRGGSKFDAVVLVTADAKKDWSYSGRAHPILSSEVESVVGTPFALWDLDRLQNEIEIFLGENNRGVQVTTTE